MADDDSKKIAERYTRALFALAQSHGLLEALERDMAALKAAVAASGDLRDLFATPLLPREIKAKAVDAVLERMGADNLTRHFVWRLALAQRLSALPEIFRAWEAILLAHRGETAATVVSAAPLVPAQQQEVAKMLSKAWGRPVRLSAKVDPSLLGGLVVKAGGLTVDASVRNQLERLRSALKAA